MHHGSEQLVNLGVGTGLKQLHPGLQRLQERAVRGSDLACSRNLLAHPGMKVSQSQGGGFAGDVARTVACTRPGRTYLLNSGKTVL